CWHVAKACNRVIPLITACVPTDRRKVCAGYVTRRWQSRDMASVRDDSAATNVSRVRHALTRCLRMRRQHVERTHHLVVFVLQQMAMPYIAPGLALETHGDARDHARIGAHGIFPAKFLRFGRYRRPGEHQLAMRVPCEQIERPAIDDLEAHQVQMDRMRITGEIDETPRLDSVLSRLF